MAEYKTYNNKFMKRKILYIVLTMIVSSLVVLEKMGWWEHLWFNGIVCFLCVLVILTEQSSTINPFFFYV